MAQSCVPGNAVRQRRHRDARRVKVSRFCNSDNTGQPCLLHRENCRFLVSCGQAMAHQLPVLTSPPGVSVRADDSRGDPLSGGRGRAWRVAEECCRGLISQRLALVPVDHSHPERAACNHCLMRAAVGGTVETLCAEDRCSNNLDAVFRGVTESCRWLLRPLTDARFVRAAPARLLCAAARVRVCRHRCAGPLDRRPLRRACAVSVAECAGRNARRALRLGARVPGRERLRVASFHCFSETVSLFW
jgi:hypothetical protein